MWDQLGLAADRMDCKADADLEVCKMSVKTKENQTKIKNCKRKVLPTPKTKKNGKNCSKIKVIRKRLDF